MHAQRGDLLRSIIHGGWVHGRRWRVWQVQLVHIAYGQDLCSLWRPRAALATGLVQPSSRRQLPLAPSRMSRMSRRLLWPLGKPACTRCRHRPRDCALIHLYRSASLCLTLRWCIRARRSVSRIEQCTSLAPLQLQRSSAAYLTLHWRTSMGRSSGCRARRSIWIEQRASLGSLRVVLRMDAVRVRCRSWWHQGLAIRIEEGCGLRGRWIVLRVGVQPSLPRNACLCSTWRPVAQFAQRSHMDGGIGLLCEIITRRREECSVDRV